MTATHHAPQQAFPPPPFPRKGAQVRPDLRAGNWATTKKRSRGQAMIEYIVVLAFGVILLIKPIPSASQDPTSPIAAGSSDSAVKLLANAIKNYHKHYTYAMSIAYIPDCDYSTTLFDPAVDDSYIAQLTGGITISGDRCVDWQNPEIPIPSISLGALTDMPAMDNIKSAVQKIVYDMVNQALSDFLNPGAIFTDALKFDIGDFF